MAELEFATTEDMIKEIMKRNTFAGIIIYSENQHFAHGQTHDNFKVYSSVCDQNTVKLLELVKKSVAQI